MENRLVGVLFTHPSDDPYLQQVTDKSEIVQNSELIKGELFILQGSL